MCYLRTDKHNLLSKPRQSGTLSSTCVDHQRKLTIWPQVICAQRLHNSVPNTSVLRVYMFSQLQRQTVGTFRLQFMPPLHKQPSTSKASTDKFLSEVPSPLCNPTHCLYFILFLPVNAISFVPELKQKERKSHHRFIQVQRSWIYSSTHFVPFFTSFLTAGSTFLLHAHK